MVHRKSEAENKVNQSDINNDILANWKLIEADFKREYGLDLVREVRTMSWRYFLSLLVGLSQKSRFMMILQEKQEKRKDVIDDDQAMALFNSLSS